MRLVTSFCATSIILATCNVIFKKKVQLLADDKASQKTEGGKIDELLKFVVESISGDLTFPQIHAQDIREAPLPRPVWLMSFPNSGTSFTLRTVHTSSNTSYATNYGGKSSGKALYGGHSIPVNPIHPNGPYLNEIKKGKPKHYIITKTHCTGYGTYSEIKNYTIANFQDGCRSGTKTLPTKTGEGTKVAHVKYDTNTVSKAIHLLRNPFDNIVSRFHLQHNRYQRLNDTEWLAKHPRNKNGFQAWCKTLDAHFEVKKKKYYGREIAIKSRNIPCNSDFYRYIQWHNNAYEVTQKMNLPTLILHYEDYQKDYNDIHTKLSHFLKLSTVFEKEPFHWTNYSDYFSLEQRMHTISWMKSLTRHNSVHKMMKNYFSSSSNTLV